MRRKVDYIIIAKDGFPLEQIKGRPITNFFRRLFLADHKECRDCWISQQALRINQELLAKKYNPTNK